MNENENEITVSIGPKLAVFFREASPEDQAKFRTVLEALIGHMNTIDIPAIGKILDDADTTQDCCQ
jgi:hypothetical protein